MTPVDRPQYRIGTEQNGDWTLLDHSDKKEYWGQERNVHDKVSIEETPWDFKSRSMEFALPGLTVVMYKWQGAKSKGQGVETKAKAKVAKQKSSPPLQGAGGQQKAKAEAKEKEVKPNHLPLSGREKTNIPPFGSGGGVNKGGGGEKVVKSNLSPYQRHW